MHIAIVTAALGLLLLGQAPVPDAYAQTPRSARNPAAAQTRRRPVQPKAAAPASPEEQQIRQDLLLSGSSSDSINAIRQAFATVRLDPVQLAIGAALLLVVQGILRRLWRLCRRIALAVLHVLVRRTAPPSPPAAPPPVLAAA